jgi:L-2-hydroxyglutarate oxidase LhgO
MLMLLIEHENVSNNISKVIHATLEYNPGNIKIEPQHYFMLMIHVLLFEYNRI